MPSEESLRKQEYYGHPHNQFWRLLFSIYNEPFVCDYRERVAFLLRKNIGVWDVLQSCEGEGSLDSNIRNEHPNDFSDFFAKYPNIRYICFTSKKAQQFYKKYVGIHTDHIFLVLSSPSPANARKSFSEKKDEWQEILESILSL